MAQRWKQGIQHPITIAVLTGAVFFPALPSTAQLLPDNTLGSENSVITSGVNPVGQASDVIAGGARRGGNLFHSFEEFNVGNLQRVYFTNPTGVENILSRVTGSNRSNIRGTLGVLGDANLFLLNPNGILFGPNATLDIRGSFVASTASSIRFADGVEFSAANPSSTPLLTISVPIGLQFNGGEGDIIVQAGQVPRSTNPFNEMGDAGQLLRTAQTVNSPTSEVAFDAISGNLNPETDVDLYQLFLTEGQPFTASTVGGTSINTQLFLFDSNGLGLFANTDSVGFQSTLPLYQPFIPDRSGIYYLGISSYDNDPRSSQGDIFDAVETPNGSGAAFSLSGWDEFPLIPTVRSASGVYTITLNSRREGLQVQPGRTLALVGNRVRLEGGSLEAPGGRVELVGVDGAGMVGLAQRGQEWRLNIPDRLASGDVFLRGNSLVNVSSRNGGSITFHGRNVSMTTSSLLAGIAPGLGSVGSRAGNIEINATTVNLDASTVTNDVAIGAIGNSGNISLNTESFSATNGAGLYSRIYGIGNAGNITIEARDAVSFDYSQAFSVVTPTGQGRGGEIRITAGSVSVTSLAQLATLTQGIGDAGNIIITARDTVRFDGSDPRLQIASSAFSSVGDGSPDGRTARGNGGDIRITANSVFFTNNARLIAATNRQGNAGNVIINARDTVSFDGGSGAASGVFPDGNGNGGSINITSDSLLLSDGAALAVNSIGSGRAGSLTVEASRIHLDNQASIDAGTVSGGGNVDLRSPFLILRNNSTITTNAQSAGMGGNINIDAGSGFIVSPFNENNDIFANAEEGSGGQITLSAQGIYGFNVRTREDLQRLLNPINPLDPQRLQTNDITAFSQANPTIDTGSVAVQTPDLDPTQGVTALPNDFTDSSQLIAATCPADEESSFAITGRGGLPEDPRQPLMGQVVWQDERGGAEAGEAREEGEGAIAEAQGWIVDRTGTVVLVAQHPQIQGTQGFNTLSCPVNNDQ